MALQLSNNYAARTISNLDENAANITVLCVFRTPAGTVNNGGVGLIYNNAANRYCGVRIAAGMIEAGARTANQTPINLGAVAPSTQYIVSTTKTAAGSVSSRLNNGAALTASVTTATIAYNRYGVGTYFNGSQIATTNVEVCYFRVFNRILTAAELDAFHAGNQSGIDPAGIIDGHDLISDLNSDFGGAALTWTDAEGDPPVFTAYDPFAPLYSVTNINGGSSVTYGQAVTWTATGFSPNAATVDGISAAAVSASGMTLPPLVDGQAAPRPGSRAVLATEDVNSANGTVSVSEPAGYQYVQLTTQTTDPAKATPPEAQPGWHWMVETKNNTVATANGLVTTDHAGEVLAWLIRDDTKIAGQYAIIFGEGGEYIETRKISARKIYAEKIKAVKITASKI